VRCSTAGFRCQAEPSRTSGQAASVRYVIVYCVEGSFEAKRFHALTEVEKR
jgi:hypothetical protein